MHRGMQIKLEQKQQTLHTLARTLDAVSPLGTLERGYSIVSHATNGQILHDSKQVSRGDSLSIQLAKGQISAQVTGHSSRKAKDKQ